MILETVSVESEDEVATTKSFDVRTMDLLLIFVDSGVVTIRPRDDKKMSLEAFELFIKYYNLDNDSANPKFPFLKDNELKIHEKSEKLISFVIENSNDTDLDDIRCKITDHFNDRVRLYTSYFKKIVRDIDDTNIYDNLFETDIADDFVDFKTISKWENYIILDNIYVLVLLTLFKEKDNVYYKNKYETYDFDHHLKCTLILGARIPVSIIKENEKRVKLFFTSYNALTVDNIITNFLKPALQIIALLVKEGYIRVIHNGGIMNNDLFWTYRDIFTYSIYKEYLITIFHDNLDQIDDILYKCDFIK